MFTARKYLSKVADTMYASGDPDKEFFYLAGPMTGIASYNFPEFIRIGSILRAKGMNIISPAELEVGEGLSAIMESPDGLTPTGTHWSEYMARDIMIVSMPTCKGGIFIPGWTESSGACLEGEIMNKLNKQLFEFIEGEDSYELVEFAWPSSRPYPQV